MTGSSEYSKLLSEREYSDLARAADNWRLLKEAMIRSSNRIQPGRLDMVDDSDLLDVAARALDNYFRMAEELKELKHRIAGLEK